MPILSYSLRPAVEADALAMAHIKLSNAGPFSSIVEGLDGLSEFQDIPAHIVENAVQDVLARIREATSDPAEAMATVVTRDEDGGVVAWANWKIYRKPQPEEELPKEPDLAKLSERERNIRACIYDFKTALVKGRNEHTLGQPNLRLRNLFTDPAHHRKGLASMLLKQGTDLADELGVVSYLEASPMGKPLYARRGYVEVGAFTLDLAKYRHNSVSESSSELYTTTLMLRKPRRTA